MCRAAMAASHLAENKLNLQSRRDFVVLSADFQPSATTALVCLRGGGDWVLGQSPRHGGRIAVYATGVPIGGNASYSASTAAIASSSAA